MKAAVYTQDYVDLLVQRAGPRAWRHPSPRMLDRIEGAITDRAAAERYLDALLDLLEKQRHPSHQLLSRIARILHALNTVDGLDALARQQQR